MRIEASLSDTAIHREIGERIAAIRLVQNVTQKELAERSGVSLQSIKRLESGTVATRLSIFIAACRALGVVDRFELLLPMPAVQPVELLKLQGKRRQRARKRVEPSVATWTWGEDA